MSRRIIYIMNHINKNDMWLAINHVIWFAISINKIYDDMIYHMLFLLRWEMMWIMTHNIQTIPLILLLKCNKIDPK